jgi:hypothetical protein
LKFVSPSRGILIAGLSGLVVCAGNVGQSGREWWAGTLLQQVPALAALAGQHLLPSGQARQGRRPFVRLAPTRRSSRRPPISQGRWPTRNRAQRCWTDARSCPALIGAHNEFCVRHSRLAPSANGTKPLAVGRIVVGRLLSLRPLVCSVAALAAALPPFGPGPHAGGTSIEMSMRLRRILTA